MSNIVFIPPLFTQVSFSRSVDVYSLSCQFYYTCETLRTLAKKKVAFKYIDLTVDNA